MAGLLPWSLFAVALLTGMGDIPFVVTLVVFWAVGGVMVRHRAGKAVGRLPPAAGGSQTTYVCAQQCAVRPLAVGHAWPGGGVAPWLAFTISPFGSALCEQLRGAGSAMMGPNSLSLWLHPTVPVRCRRGRDVGQPTTRSA